MDFLFAAKTPWVWDAEKNFARLKEEHPEIAQAAHSGKMVHDIETGRIGISVRDESSGDFKE